MNYADYQGLTSERAKNLAVMELLYEIRDKLPEAELPKEKPQKKQKKAIKVLTKGMNKSAKGIRRKRKEL